MARSPIASARARVIVVVAGARRSRFWSAAHWTTGWAFTALICAGGFLLQSTLPVNVTFRPATGAGQRGNRVVADDGLRAGAAARCWRRWSAYSATRRIEPRAAGHGGCPAARGGGGGCDSRPGRPIRAFGRSKRSEPIVQYARLCRCPATRDTRTSATRSARGRSSPAIKILIIANVAAFLLSSIVPSVIERLGLSAGGGVRTARDLAAGHLHVPARRDRSPAVQHARRSGCSAPSSSGRGARDFSRSTTSSAVSGAAVTTLLWAISPLPFADAASITRSTIGASGAIYGVLLAYAHVLPAPAALLYFMFPVPARYTS